VNLLKIVLTIVTFSSIFSSNFIQSFANNADIEQTNSLQYQKNDEKQLLNAMKDEMNRSLSKLRLAGVDSLYYLQYQLQTHTIFEVKASMGGIVKVTKKPFATLSVQARVGSPQLDNTNFFDVSLNFFGSSDEEESFENRLVPFELDYSIFRNELWLATDVAYKQATEIYAKKLSFLQNKIRKDSTPDFYQLPSISISLPLSTAYISLQDESTITFAIASLSKKFLNYPDIVNSQVNFEFIDKRLLFSNSEGREFAKSDVLCGFEAVAMTQREDGMLLTNTHTSYTTNPKKFQLEQIGSNNHPFEKALDSLANAAVLLKKAKPLDDSYSGPVMFTSQATGELFGQFFAPNLVLQRQALSDQGFDASRNLAFQNKVGGRVFPTFLSMYATTGSKKYQDSVVGAFQYDDQGIQTPEKIELVKDGYLVTLLNDRTITKKITLSNGHHRSGGTAPGILEITSSNTKDTYESLKLKMIELCKKRDLPFGLVVKKILNQNLLFTTIYRLTEGEYPIARGETKVNAIEVYKVYLNGKEELITSPEISGLGVSIFKEIIGSSNKTATYSYLASAVISPFITGGSQFLATTLYYPETVLIEEIEIKPNQEDFSKPPILSSPLSIK